MNSDLFIQMTPPVSRMHTLWETALTTCITCALRHARSAAEPWPCFTWPSSAMTRHDRTFAFHSSGSWEINLANAALEAGSFAAALTNARLAL